jgi:Domain of unknown function (DUF4386)
MTSQTRFAQRVGALGIVYALVFAVGFVLVGNGPSVTASGATVVRYYLTHKTSAIAAVFAIAFASVALVLFASLLRRFLARTNDSGVLSSAITAGSAVYATGVLFMATVTIGLMDAAKHSMNGVAQTLNVLSSDDWVLVVTGISMTALATGILSLRSRALPRWLGWVSIVLGILAVAGPVGGIAFLLFPVWILVLAAFIIRRGSDVADDVPLPIGAATR